MTLRHRVCSIAVRARGGRAARREERRRPSFGRLGGASMTDQNYLTIGAAGAPRGRDGAHHPVLRPEGPAATPAPKASRTSACTTDDDEERLYRILTLKYLGFSLAQIREAEGRSTTARKLSGALEHRMHELERESSRDPAQHQHHQQPPRAARCERARALERLCPSHQRYAEPRGRAVAGTSTARAATRAASRELTHEAVSRWHELMGDTIEAMH